MSVTRYRDGNVTVTLSGDLEKLVRDAVNAAAGETVKVMETAANEVADAARSAWYHRVDRETGKSGTIAVITTVDVGRDEVRVGVGSTDDRKAGKTNKPVVAFVHAPNGDSRSLKSVSRAEWYATNPALRGPIMFGDEVYRPVNIGGQRATVPESRLRYLIYAHNPKASDGKYLLAEFIRKPMTAKVKAVSPQLAQTIAARIARG